MNNRKLRIVKVSNLAKLPYRSFQQAAGYDLYSIENKIIDPHNKALIDTGIQIEIPDNCYGRIAPRSGLALNHSLDIGAGVIDSDYRGNIKVLIFNHSDKAYTVKIGDRIAELILSKIERLEIEEVNCLNKSQRENHGFGSSGY